MLLVWCHLLTFNIKSHHFTVLFLLITLKVFQNSFLNFLKSLKINSLLILHSLNDLFRNLCNLKLTQLNAVSLR